MRTLIFVLHIAFSPSPSPCHNSNELLKAGPMQIGVRFRSMTPETTLNAARALDYWSSVLDMKWYEDESDSCAIDLEPHQWSHKGDSFTIGEASIGGLDGFDGVLLYSSRPKEATTALFIHELGHIFGLKHSKDESSVMYWLSGDDRLTLSDGDKQALCRRHTLNKPLAITPGA